MLFVWGLSPNALGVDSPFFSTIILSKNRIRFPRVSGGFLEGSLERVQMEGLRRNTKVQPLQVARPALPQGRGYGPQQGGELFAQGQPGQVKHLHAMTLGRQEHRKGRPWYQKHTKTAREIADCREPFGGLHLAMVLKLRLQ